MPILTTTRRPAAFLASILVAGALVALAAPFAQAAKGDCGQPLSTGSASTAGDALSILRSATGSVVCELCVCDVNNNGSITSADALLTLKKAVGAGLVLNCPSCGGATTTTTISVDKPSTTSTSTTSTTTTVPVHCGDNSACAALPSGFRCNPNTGTCEKPCAKNVDCKDFYECNKATGYCQAPALLF